jgi:hypothetical protein
MEWKWFAAGIAIAVLAAVLFSMARQESQQSERPREIAALMSGEPIYAGEVELELQTVPEGMNVSWDDALSFVVERKVLVQEAERKGIVATTAEVKDAMDGFRQQQNWTGSNEALLQRMEWQVMINKLLEQSVPKSIVVKFEEVEAHYNRTYAGSNVTFDEAEQRILEKLTAEKRQAARKSFIAALKERADVVVVSGKS